MFKNSLSHTFVFHLIKLACDKTKNHISYPIVWTNYSNLQIWKTTQKKYKFDKIKVLAIFKQVRTHRLRNNETIRCKHGYEKNIPHHRARIITSLQLSIQRALNLNLLRYLVEKKDTSYFRKILCNHITIYF